MRDVLMRLLTDGLHRLKPTVALVVVAATSLTYAQTVASANQSAELIALRQQIASPETRVRVAAMHRVWTIGLEADDSEVKRNALQLLAEPVGSASDHIRMPAVYAMAEIANRSEDARVKVRALELLAEPLRAAQVPIRDVAIDAVNIITGSSKSPEVAIAAVRALGEPVRSGNNGVRIPAINAVVRAVRGCGTEVACSAALDLMTAPLDSASLIGGMEVRLMAVVALERIALDAFDNSSKAKAMGMLRMYAAKPTWEPEAKRRAEEAAAKIQQSLSAPSQPKPRSSVSS